MTARDIEALKMVAAWGNQNLSGRTLAPQVRRVFGRKTLNSLAGLSGEELQQFPEGKAGISPDEEAQSCVNTSTASITFHY